MYSFKTKHHRTWLFRLTWFSKFISRTNASKTDGACSFQIKGKLNTKIALFWLEVLYWCDLVSLLYVFPLYVTRDSVINDLWNVTTLTLTFKRVVINVHGWTNITLDTASFNYVTLKSQFSLWLTIGCTRCSTDVVGCYYHKTFAGF